MLGKVVTLIFQYLFFRFVSRDDVLWEPKQRLQQHETSNSGEW
jgi:hypothetical protein